jgi:hypothetical protein
MIGQLFDKLGVPRKLAYMVTSVALSSGLAMLRSKYPGVEFPDPDYVLAMGGLTIAGHTATDMMGRKLP